MLEIKNLTFEYQVGTLVLNDLNLIIPKGKIIGLLGGNGAGKTTTLKLILGLLPISKGEIIMYITEEKFDFHPIGNAIKKARESRGRTQEYLSQLVDRSPRYIMYIENKGQHPSLNTFYQLVTLLDISVDQYFFDNNLKSGRRMELDIVLNALSEKELSVIEATAQGLKKARELEE